MEGMVFSDVRKRFGQVAVLDGVSCVVPPGRVTAFLGPNGAGKTTSLRIAATLSRATSGTVTFDGAPLDRHPYPAQIAGFCLDATAMHPGRSVRSTLAHGAMLVGVPGRSADVMVDFVGLGSVARRPVGHLSLGMRQRLALGLALLGKPRYLVLDEPLNGLDVEGVVWMRSVMRAVADDGGAVLLSSHLLREVQSTADHVVMIDRGAIVAEGPLGAFTTSSTTAVATIPEHRDYLVKVLVEAGVDVQQEGQSLQVSTDASTVGRLAAQHGVVLTHLNDQQADSLEHHFRRLTQGEYQVGTSAHE